MLDPKNLNPGEEKYEKFTHRRKIRYQYDFRATDGELFSCIKQTLKECRKARDEWKNKRKKEV